MELVPVERLTPERRRALTRTALVEAAAEVFARRGFHAASLDEIAETAGFTRGAIYSNFSGKEDLLLAVLDQYTDRQLEAFAEVLDRTSGSSTAGQASAAAGVWGESQRENPSWALLSLEMRLYALRNSEFRRRLAAFERRQQERIAEFIEAETRRQGVVLKMSASDLADIGRAVSDGLSQMTVLDPDRSEHYRRIAGVFFGFIDSSIVTPGSDAPAKPKPRRNSRG